MRSCFVVSVDRLAIHTVVSVGSLSGGVCFIGPYLILSMSSVFCCTSVSIILSISVIISRIIWLSQSSDAWFFI